MLLKERPLDAEPPARLPIDHLRFERAAGQILQGPLQGLDEEPLQLALQEGVHADLGDAVCGLELVGLAEDSAQQFHGPLAGGVGHVVASPIGEEAPVASVPLGVPLAWAVGQDVVSQLKHLD